MMKNPIQAVLLFLVSAMAVPGMTTAQGRAEDTREKSEIMQPTDAARNHNMYRGSKIIGADLRDPQDKKLGEIADIVLDRERGEAAYIVVSFGGVMGVGSKYHPIPWKALQASDDGRYYILHADRETVSNAPGFDKGKWPDMADQKWSADVERYWNKMVGHSASGGIATSSGAGSGSKGNAGDDGVGRRTAK
jgi:sporulation protein YlmC with PRC-barrel domain